MKNIQETLPDDLSGNWLDPKIKAISKRFDIELSNLRGTDDDTDDTLIIIPFADFFEIPIDTGRIPTDPTSVAWRAFHERNTSSWEHSHQRIMHLLEKEFEESCYRVTSQYREVCVDPNGRMIHNISDIKAHRNVLVFMVDQSKLARNLERNRIKRFPKPSLVEKTQAKITDLFSKK